MRRVLGTAALLVAAAGAAFAAVPGHATPAHHSLADNGVITNHD
jgi:hypothetical protein